jgi:hypothetical protein
MSILYIIGNLFSLCVQINESLDKIPSERDENSIEVSTKMEPTNAQDESEFQMINLEQFGQLCDFNLPTSTPVNLVKELKGKAQPKSFFTLTPVSEDFIKIFVTPKKAKKVHEAMALEKEAHRCTLKILGCFFKNEELKTNNVSGMK